MIVAMRYRWTHKTVYSASYQLFWCPRYRRGVLASGVEERREAISAEAAAEASAEVGAEVVEVEVLADQVRLLAEVPPTVPLSRFVGLLEGRSCRLLGMEFPRLRCVPVLWSPWWLVSTVGGAPAGVVRRCVQDQRAGSGR